MKELGVICQFLPIHKGRGNQTFQDCYGVRPVLPLIIDGCYTLLSLTDLRSSLDAPREGTVNEGLRISVSHLVDTSMFRLRGRVLCLSEPL
jgi:hypothetical protein